jgi:hypothetical protein
MKPHRLICKPARSKLAFVDGKGRSRAFLHPARQVLAIEERARLGCNRREYER